MKNKKLLPELEKEFYEKFTKPVNTTNGIERYLDLDYQTKPQEILDWVDDNFVPVDLLVIPKIAEDDEEYCKCEIPTLGKSVARCGTCGNWFKKVR